MKLHLSTESSVDETDNVYQKGAILPCHNRYLLLQCRGEIKEVCSPEGGTGSTALCER